MNADQLRCIIKCDTFLSYYITGVFSEDTFPFTLAGSSYGFIVNTDKHDLPGKHWVAFYVSADGQGYFMDSFGKHPLYYSQRFYRFFTENHLELIYNKKQLQSTSTNFCGLYSCYFLLMLSRNQSYCYVLDVFADNTTLNDSYVYNLMINVFPLCLLQSNESNAQLCCPLF